MSSDRLPTHLLINAALRTAAAEGIVLTVLRKGEQMSGAIILKHNNLAGGFRVLTQARKDEDLVWLQITGATPVSEIAADKALADTAGFDPDAWIVEIEDRENRLWFTGKVVV